MENVARDTTINRQEEIRKRGASAYVRSLRFGSSANLAFAAVLLVTMAVEARSNIYVNDTQVWSDFSRLSEELEIGPEGNLTINVSTPEYFRVMDNGKILLNGGYLEINYNIGGISGQFNMVDDSSIVVNEGQLIVNGGNSFEMKGNSILTMNGGYVGLSLWAGDLEIWDDISILMNHGTFHVDTLRDFDHDKASPGQRIIIGGGVMQVVNEDPQSWIDAGLVGLAPGYTELLVTPDTGQGYAELSAIAEPSTLGLLLFGALAYRYRLTGTKWRSK